MTRTPYENFDLRLAYAQGRYVAFADDYGCQSDPFTAPFEQAELDAFLARGSLGALREIELSGGAGGLSEGAAKAFGEKLFDTVFSGRVRDCWRESLGHEERGLRLRLRFTEAPELASLPWEYLYDAHQATFPGLLAATPIVRYLEVPRRIEALEVVPPLNVLVVAANANGGAYAPLDVAAEVAHPKDALASLRRRGLVADRYLEEVTLGALRGELRRFQPHIFHFIGHGDFDGAEGKLLFRDGPVGSEALKLHLADAKDLKIAVLNACKGARSAAKDPFVGVAQALVRAGVPAVVAMQFAVTDRAAVAFADEFYRALAEDSYPVEAALAEARKALHQLAQPHLVEWGTPVLFLRAEDGALLNLKVQKAVGGLGDLPKLLDRSPEARELLARSRNDVAVVQSHLNVLGSYKDLHDQLHHLQFRCYGPIAGLLWPNPYQAAPPALDAASLDTLRTCRLDLREVIAALRAITQRASFPPYDVSWLGLLEGVFEQLRQAISRQERSGLVRVKRELDRVLNTQPVKINERLRVTAENLNLGRVVSVLQQLRGLLQAQLEPERVSTFAAGVEGLTRLNGRLEALLQQHNGWQAAETELRNLIDSGFGETEADAAYFSERWGGLEREIAALQGALQDGALDDEFRDCAQRIGDAVAAGAAAQVVRELEFCYRLMSRDFFQVDSNLKALCGELREADKPLADVLAAL